MPDSSLPPLVSSCPLEYAAALGTGVPAEGLRPLSLRALLGGARVYEFPEFYAAKNVLLRYDGRRDYLNYGFWRNGDSTANPSSALVLAVGEAAELGPGDLVANIGSGLGQPDVDLVRTFHVDRVVGINLHSGQANHANRRADAEGLAGCIEHRVADALHLGTALSDFRPTRVVAIESLAEMPDVAGVVRAVFDRLVPGGRLAFCDIVATGAGGPLSRGFARTLTRTTAALYGDCWRTAGDYAAALTLAGFTGIVVRSIGAHVYGPTFRHARRRFRGLRGIPRQATAMGLAALNLGTLAALHALGWVDYIIVSARKPA